MFQQVVLEILPTILNCHILSWSYDGVCSDTNRDRSAGRNVSQCVVCGSCIGATTVKDDAALEKMFRIHVLKMLIDHMKFF